MFIKLETTKIDFHVYYNFSLYDFSFRRIICYRAFDNAVLYIRFCRVGFCQLHFYLRTVSCSKTTLYRVVLMTTSTISVTSRKRNPCQIAHWRISVFLCRRDFIIIGQQSNEYKQILNIKIVKLVKKSADG